MSLQNLLDVFLITYNRSRNLDQTLSQIFSESSPIKDFAITIIDNDSTDNTKEIIEKYQQVHSNITYKKNKYNIGGNANIARTYEYVEKKYFWILCDDDEYDWSNWSEVESAINNDEDAIVVCHSDTPKLGKAQIFAQSSFVPGVIYKSSILDEDVIANIQFNISNMFPHMALSAKLFNEGKEFYVVSKPIVVFKGVDVPVETTYTRGHSSKYNLSQLMREMSYSAGYANTLYLIKDKKLRNELAMERRFFLPRLNSALVFFMNQDRFNNSLYNLLCIFNVLNLYDKIRFLINWLLYLTIYQLLYIYKEENYLAETDEIKVNYKMRLFHFIKTNLFKYQYKYKGEIK